MGGFLMILLFLLAVVCFQWAAIAWYASGQKLLRKEIERLRTQSQNAGESNIPAQ